MIYLPFFDFVENGPMPHAPYTNRYPARIGIFHRKTHFHKPLFLKHFQRAPYGAASPQFQSAFGVSAKTVPERYRYSPARFSGGGDNPRAVA